MRLLAALLALSLIAGNVQRADASTPTTKRKQAISARRSPQVSLIYSMTGCGPCDKLEATVSAKCAVKVDYIATKPVGIGSFPHVEYSDGTSDYGQKYYAGGAKLPKHITIIKWRVQ
jgi:hypothetical protein